MVGKQLQKYGNSVDLLHGHAYHTILGYLPDS